jgi:cytochrome P450
VNTGCIRSARQRRADESASRSAPQNLLQAMVAAADVHGSDIDDEQVAGNVPTVLLAGVYTTANTLAWCIWLLHRRSQALARARAEVSGVMAEGGPVTLEHLARLDYLEACTHETMRLKPVVPQLVLQALKDTMVGDVAAPRARWSST